MLQSLAWLTIIMISSFDISISTSDKLFEKAIGLLLEDAQISSPDNILGKRNPILLEDDQVPKSDREIADQNTKQPDEFGGWCLNGNGEDENAGTIRVAAASTKDGCLAACQKNQNANGCEWESNICTIHTNQVCSGSGKGRGTCWVLKACTAVVSCGHHTAVTCSECTKGGRGASWCNGDCKWCSGNGVCHPKDKDCPGKACATNNGGCDHECIDLGNGKHECKCRYGFDLENDEKTCSGMPSRPVVTVDEKCTFKCGYTPINNEVTYEVKWYAKDGNKYDRIKTNGGTSLSGLECKYTAVYCTIKYWYPTEPKVRSEIARNDDFTGATYDITFDKPLVNLTEGGPAADVKVCLKVPCLNCKGTKVKLNPHAGLSVKPCSIEFTETEKCKTVSIYAMHGYVKDSPVDTTITPTLDGCTDCKLTVVGLKIRRNKFTGGKKGECSAYGDPHIKSFDGQQYPHYTVGEYLLAKSNVRRFEVHAKYQACSDSVLSCNCGVAVREDDDVLLVSQCDGSTPIAKYLTNKQPQKGTFIEKENDKYWQIRTRSGAKIEFTAHATWWANINVHVPAEDFGNLHGICGTFDGVYNDEDNLESFKLSKAESLLEFTDTGPAVCLNADGCAPDTYQNTPTSGWSIVAPQHNCSQGTAPVGDEIQNDIDIPSFPTKSGTTKKEANAYCKEKIEGSPIYKACNSAIPEGFSAEGFVQACVADIQIIDKKVEAWEAALEALVYDCTEIVHDRKLPSTKVDNLVCPNECSGHGTCNKRTCICDEGYGTIDCSEKTGSK